MIRLTNSTSDLVSLITAQNGAKTVAAFTDTTATTWAGSNEVHSITSATTTTIVATPAASTIREIDFINIYNTYAGSQLLTVQQSVSATFYILVAFTLLQGESLQYTHAGGWCALDVNGNRKEVTSSLFSSLGVAGTSTLGTVNASGLITASGGIAGALTGTASGNLVSGGALGTPSSGVVTNLTGTAAGVSIGGNAATATTATNFNNGTSSSSAGTVTSTTVTATNIGGTLSTAAQPNITSVGTLTSVTSSGAISGATGVFSGAINGSSLNVILPSGNIVALSLIQTGVTTWNVLNNATTGLFSIEESGIAKWFDLAKTTGAAKFYSSLAVTGTLSASATIQTGGYTVGTLPSGTIGMKAYVTDALAPAFLVLLASGGSAYSGAQYNGTQWVGD